MNRQPSRDLIQIVSAIFYAGFRLGENAWYVRPVGVSVLFRRGESMWEFPQYPYISVGLQRKTVEEGPEGPARTGH
jgi:hypothetical protein